MASAPLVLLGDRLGLYKAMAGAGPMTADQLSDKSGLRFRYAQEWLNAQAASGFVEYDPREDSFTLTPEAALVLSDDSSPTVMVVGLECLASLYLDLDKVQKAFVDGTDLGWREHHPSCYHEPSIAAARRRAAEAGVGDRVTFEVAGAKTYPDRGFDLIAFFDCLHDMGDPVGAAETPFNRVFEVRI